MTVAERLNIFIDSLGISVQEFEKKASISGGTASRLTSKSYAKTFGRIQHAFPQLDIEWLKTGEGKMLKGNAKEVGGVYSAGAQDEEVVMVDYIPVSATASFIESLGDYMEWEDKYPIIPMANERNNISEYKIFEVEGDSMYPTLVSGASILTKEIPESSWHYAEGVVVVVFGEYVVVKRIASNRLLTDNFIVLASDNERYGTMTVPLSDLRGIFKAKRILNSPIN